MKNINKFQIYYKPIGDTTINSFTLSISRINEVEDTYKLKLIKEINSNLKIDTYKIKEFHSNVNDIITKINKIDFEKDYDKCKDNKEIFCIKLDDKKIMTSNKEQIQYILDLFNFDKFYDINVFQYKKIKNIYEYIR